MSNRQAVLVAIPESCRAKEVRRLDQDHLPVERVFGVKWCIKLDMFKFKILLKERSFTSGGILSTVSSIFDPLGMLSSIVLTAKKIERDLSRRAL